MNYKRAEVNGINIQGLQGHSQELWDEFTTRASELRADAKEIIEGKPGDFHFGSRFADNRRVAERAIGAIASKGISFTTLGADLMDEYIIAAFIDAAGADHWYTFEKNWE